MNDSMRTGGDGIFERLRRGAEDFSPQQRAICSFILDHYRQVVFMTVEELAEKTKTSPATVVRTSTKLGFESFSTFKEALRGSLLATMPTLWWQMEESWERQGQEGMESLHRIIDKNVESLRGLVTPHMQESLPRAIRRLCEARRIYVLALRSTRSASVYFHSLTNQFLGNVVLVDHSGSDEMFGELVDMKSDDLLLAITINGPHYASRTVDAVRYAHHRKVPSVLITTELTCPAVPYATEVLCVPPVTEHYTIVPVLCLFDVLIAEMGQCLKETGRDKLRELERILSETGITL